MGGAATVSYIVAVFNAEATLRHCLDSLINQTYKEIEILLINDGSTDNSADICEEYACKDSRIRLIHQSNSGVSRTRQRGLDEARGKYVIHADPDDWIEPDSLRQMVAYAEACHTDILISDFWHDCGEKSTQCIQKPTGSTQAELTRDLLTILHGGCWNKLIRLDTIRRHGIGFHPDLTYCEDLLFNLQLLSKEVSYGYIGIAHYHYVDHGNLNSLTRKYDIDMLANDMILFAEVQRTIPQHEHPHTLPHLAALLANRAFDSQILSDKAFHQHFSGLTSYVRMSRRYPASRMILLYLSCIGYHGLAQSAARGHLTPFYRTLICTYNYLKRLF